MDNQNNTPSTTNTAVPPLSPVPPTEMAPTVAATPSPSTPPPASAQPSAPPAKPGQPSYILFLTLGIIIVLVLIGALFVLGIKQTDKGPVNVLPTPRPTVPIEVTPTPADSESTGPTLSPSDDLNVLDKEAGETDITGMNKDLDALSNEAQNL